MQLRYRGITYSNQNTQVETVASDGVAKFLGQTYSLRHPVQRFKPHLGLRKYRGIAYGC
ncbi:MAG: DUF4278 domain-containing protein [Xenococcus sp. MO_188.B8]|nr:DUF4278 domain-containing protein [Xenococcus sp. MO_188.B8]